MSMKLLFNVNIFYVCLFSCASVELSPVFSLQVTFIPFDKTMALTNVLIFC